MIKSAVELQKLIEQAGFATLACGGFVRDHLLNRPYKDIDLATQATPERVIKILKSHNIKVIETGLKHGTVTTIYNGFSFEITTLRKDVSCDGRHANVEFTTSFEEDAKRRDFTINAMYMDLIDGEISDFHNGKDDLKNKIVRFVGYHEDRIKEDYLRILRGVRFSATLRFQLNYMDAACFNLLWLVSSERIKSEIDKIFSVDNLYIKYPFNNILIVLLPELGACVRVLQENDYHIHSVSNHILSCIENCLNIPVIRWAALFHDLGKVQTKSTDKNGVDHFYSHENYSVAIADRIMDRLKFSNKEKEVVKWLVQNHMKIGNPTKRVIRTLINEAVDLGDVKYFDYLVNLKKADLLSGSEKAIGLVPEWEKKIKELYNESKDLKEKLKLDISGHDIADIFGIKAPNKQIGSYYYLLYMLVINGELKNDFDCLRQKLLEIKGVYENEK